MRNTSAGANVNVVADHMEVATENDIPVAPVHTAFHGPTGDEDADEKGYFSDGLHPSKLGATVIADAHRELGYEPI